MAVSKPKHVATHELIYSWYFNDFCCVIDVNTSSLLVSQSVLRTYYIHLLRGKSEDGDTNSYEMLLPTDWFTTCYNP